MVIIRKNKEEIHGVERAWMSAQGFHQPRHMPAVVEEVPQDPQQVVEHTHNEKYPTDTCRNLTLPELLNHSLCPV